jgi:hypothetical protein
MHFGRICSSASCFCFVRFKSKSFRLEIEKIKIQELARNEGNSSNTNLIISSSIERSFRSLGVFLQNWEIEDSYQSQRKINL